MTYKLFEHDRVKKFFKKHKNDKKLLLRITKKYYEILDNPYDAEFIELTSVKCPKCQRARVGSYRIIFFVSENTEQIEIIDIIKRKNDYRMF
ncbi:type II toxin-antitoxin system RelE family toxin [Methanobrevibacter sp.]|uniref:type II toxin-antitoxin system RelE family toxin n=1 Tax=Methanobrevibacter sp. TaxID=66852 RepID=UPI00388D8D9F